MLATSLPSGGVSDGFNRHKNWHVKWTRQAFNNCPDYETALRENRPVDDELVIEENLLLNAGITTMLKLLIDSGSLNPFNNANSKIAVGDSTTAASASQTDLQASTNIQRNGMESSFPSVSGQTVTFKSSFGSSEANWAWQEFGVQNGAGAPDGTTVFMLNRKVQNLGTKVSGATWVLQVDITIS